MALMLILWVDFWAEIRLKIFFFFFRIKSVIQTCLPLKTKKKNSRHKKEELKTKKRNILN